MTAQEVAALLATLQAAYPHTELTEGTIRVWNDNVGDVDPDDAYEAARTLIREEEFFPTIAAFRECANTVARFRRMKAQPSLMALPSGERLMDPAIAKRAIAATREDLKLIGKGGTGTSLHTGERWQDCPTCSDRFNR